MICVKFTAFCDLRADLRIRLATLRKSVRKFCFCKLANWLASTCECTAPSIGDILSVRKTAQFSHQSIHFFMWNTGMHSSTFNKSRRTCISWWKGTYQHLGRRTSAALAPGSHPPVLLFHLTCPIFKLGLEVFLAALHAGPRQLLKESIDLRATKCSSISELTPFASLLMVHGDASRAVIELVSTVCRLRPYTYVILFLRLFSLSGALVSLRPVYTGDFCCDSKSDFAACNWTTGDSSRRGIASSLPDGRFEIAGEVAAMQKSPV